jgi:hypothetical protein
VASVFFKKGHGPVAELDEHAREMVKFVEDFEFLRSLNL